MEIEDARYAELVAAEQKAKSLEAEMPAKDKAIEDAEAAKVEAEQKLADEKKRADEAEEKARVAALRDERLEALGSKFTAKLDKLEATSKRVKEQAGTLSDDDWKARLDELSETLGVKSDENLAEGEKPDEEKETGSQAKDLFTREEVTASAAGSGAAAGTTSGSTPGVAQRQSVIGGLARKKAPAPAAAAK